MFYLYRKRHKFYFRVEGNINAQCLKYHVPMATSPEHMESQQCRDQPMKTIEHCIPPVIQKCPSKGFELLEDSTQDRLASLSSPRHSSSPEVDYAPPRTEDRDEIPMDTSEASEEEMKAKCLEKILRYTQNVEYARSFGLLLNIESGKLTGFEQNPEDMRSEIVQAWFQLIPMTVSERWEELVRVLLQPAVNELNLAKQLQKFLRRGSSIDSVISEMSGTSRCSVPSSPDVFPSPCTDKECTIQEALNYIAPYSDEWFNIGIGLVGDENLSGLKKIEKKVNDHKAYLVELWYKVDHRGLSWDKLRKAVGQVRERRESLATLDDENAVLFPPSSRHTTSEEKDTKKEMKVLQKQFSEIQRKLMVVLREKKVSVDELADYISTYPICASIQHKSLKLIEEDSNLRDVFMIFNERLVWSFLDFTLLKLIVKELGSNELKGQMKNYSNKLKEFRKRTKAVTLIAVWDQAGGNVRHYNECKKMFVRLRANPDECTLHDLEVIRKDACKLLKMEGIKRELNLTEAALVLYRVKYGSLELIWIVHEKFVPDFKKAFRECMVTGDFFRENSISKLEIDGEVFSLEDTEEVQEVIKEEHEKITQQFWDACRLGYFQEVKRLLDIYPALINQESEGWNALMMCVANCGHPGIISLLIEIGVELDKQDKETGNTALIMASEANNLDIVNLLLERSANPNIQEIYGMCPILIGARNDNIRLVELCLKSPLIDLGVANKEGKTALIFAVENGNVEMVNLFLRIMEHTEIEHQDAIGCAAIHVATKLGKVDIAQRLIESFPESRDLQNKEGDTLLDIAIARKSQNKEMSSGSDEDKEDSTDVELEGISEVRGKGEEDITVEEEGDKEEGKCDKKGEHKEPERDESEQRGTGSTVRRLIRSIGIKNFSLMSAAKSGKTAKVEKLLKRGVDPDTIEIDTLQWTPLMWASQKDHVETVKVLLKYKANPNLQARNGFTALILASRLGNHETVKVLLDPTNPIKTDVQIKNKTRGWSALMWACQSRGKQFDNEEARANRRIIAKDLLDAGADVNSKADNGWTPIMQASQDGDVEMVKILTSHESSKNLEIDHESGSSWTALTTACRKKHLEIIKALVDAGANVNKKKKGGVAPLHITAIKQMVEASEYLIKHGADVNIQDEWGITPLMLAVKENDREKQDYHNIIHYHIVAAKANVNLQAEKFARWTAVFFSIKNKDQKTSKFLVRNKARMDIKDEYGHTPFSISKGLILDEKIQMYKFLVNLVFPPEEESQEETIPEVTHHKERESLSEEKSFSVVDGAVYTAMDLRFRMTQLPNYLVNFNLNLPAF